MVATYHVCSLSVNGTNGYDNDECGQAKCRQLGCGIIGFQETRRAGRTFFYSGGYRVLCCGTENEDGTHRKQEQLGVGLAAKEEICRQPAYTHELVDERLVSMQFDMAYQFASINYVMVYAPTDGTAATEPNRVFWEIFDDLGDRIPRKCYLFVLINLRVRIGKKEDGGR